MLDNILGRLLNKFVESIDIKKSIISVANLAKKAHLITVDITELFFDEFNYKRFFLGIIDLIILIVNVLTWFLFYKFDFLFQLVNNPFLPKNAKVVFIAFMCMYSFAAAIRFDLMIAERNDNLDFFRIIYFFQEDIKSKIGLTEKNLRKIKIFGKLFELTIIRAIIPLFCLLTGSIYLFIAIKSNNIIILLTVPFLFHGVWIAGSTFAVTGTLVVVGLYYMKLIFDQINDEMQVIFDKSKWLITFPNQKRLIWLTHKHNYFALVMNNINLAFRRSICVYFIVFSMSLIISLNLILFSDDFVLLVVYLVYFMSVFILGFATAYFLSRQIESAHKPYKIMYKILRKRNFSLKFKLKVLIKA